MTDLRLALVLAVGSLVLGCGGGAKAPTKYTGGITLDAQGSWSVTQSDGSTIVGNESFSVHCTNDGTGVGEVTASFTVHDVETDSNGMSSTTDATGSDDEATTADSTGCILGVGGGGDTIGVQLEILGFHVTGAVVAGGISVPIDDDWSKYDLALAGAVTSSVFTNAVAGPGAATGMVSFNSGDLLGGSPTMVIAPGTLGTAIPETVSWSFAPLGN